MFCPGFPWKGGGVCIQGRGMPAGGGGSMSAFRGVCQQEGSADGMHPTGMLSCS